jgi:hypothetical protein
MMKRMKELELARDALHAMKTPLHLDSIDRFLIDECPLSESNRYELHLSTEKTFEAQKVYEKLVSILAVFKSNYSHYIEDILERVTDISELFLNNQTKEMNEQIHQLEDILLLDPKNIEAVKSLSKSIEKSLMTATSENVGNFLKKNIHQMRTSGSNPPSLHHPTATSVGAPAVPVPAFAGGQQQHQQQLQVPPPSAAGAAAANGEGFSESKAVDVASAPKYSDEEIHQLMVQNEQLRSTVTQLRQRLAQVRVSSVNNTTPAAAEKQPSTLYGKRGPSNSHFNVATLNNNNTPNRDQHGGAGGAGLMTKKQFSTSSAQDGSASGLDDNISYSQQLSSNAAVIPPSHQDLDHGNNNNNNHNGYNYTGETFANIYNADSTVVTTSANTTLPESIQALLLARMRLYINQIISGNPAVPMISSNEVLKSMVVEEIIQQMQNSINHVYELYLKTMTEFEFIFNSDTSKPVNTIDQDYLEKYPDLVVRLSETMDQTFQFSQGESFLLVFSSYFTDVLFFLFSFIFSSYGVNRLDVFVFLVLLLSYGNDSDYRHRGESDAGRCEECFSSSCCSSSSPSS